ncbi:L-seryl-tRNA(Sec) selenium transferase [Pseudalkalibacillus hwajinpoensis]
MKSLARELPPVYQVLDELKRQVPELPHNVQKQMIQDEVRELRNKLLNESYKGSSTNRIEFLKEIMEQILMKVDQLLTPNLRSVINATGVVLHTNLGRSRLSEAAIEQIVEVARGYSSLEYNVDKGTRGSRHTIAEKWICDATGAEAAMVVNNNAAAVYLILSALAKDKEVIVSRGELVEIGGSFRVSSIMEESGAMLREVGTTNKTHRADYERTIHEDTAMVMKVHRSNFTMVGFTAEVNREDLSDIAKRHNVIYYEDLGSGALFNYREYGIGQEPTVRETLEAGVDIVSFSGDKLLGGPQAGIIAGKKEFIQKLKTNQLARVLRVDKFTLAALEATLKQYIFGNEKEIPAIRDLLQGADEIGQRAKNFQEKLHSWPTTYTTEVFIGTSQVGGGTMPAVELSTSLLSITLPSKTASELEHLLRRWEVPIITRIKDERVLIDLRTVTEAEEEEIFKALIDLA